MKKVSWLVLLVFLLPLATLQAGLYDQDLLADGSFEVWEINNPEWVYYWNVNSGLHSIGTEDEAYDGERSLQLTSTFQDPLWSEDGFAVNNMRNFINQNRNYVAGDVVLLSMWVKVSDWDSEMTTSNPGIGFRLVLDPGGEPAYVAANSPFVRETEGEWREIRAYYEFSEAFFGDLNFQIRMRHGNNGEVDDIGYADLAFMQVVKELPEGWIPEEEPEPPPPPAASYGENLLRDGSFEVWEANNPEWVYYWNVGADNLIGTDEAAHDGDRAVRIANQWNPDWEEDGFTLNSDRNEWNKSLEYVTGDRAVISLRVWADDWDPDSTINNPGIGARLVLLPEGGGVDVAVVTPFVNDTDGEWVEVSAEYIFPADFVGELNFHVRYRSSDRTTGTQVAYVDSASMIVYSVDDDPGEPDPDPDGVVLTPGMLAPGVLGVSLFGETGMQYTLEFTTDLTTEPIVWTVVAGENGSAIGDDDDLTLSDESMDDGLRIYRVVVEEEVD